MSSNIYMYFVIGTLTYITWQVCTVIAFYNMHDSCNCVLSSSFAVVVVVCHLYTYCCCMMSLHTYCCILALAHLILLYFVICTLLVDVSCHSTPTVVAFCRVDTYSCFTLTSAHFMLYFVNCTLSHVFFCLMHT